MKYKPAAIPLEEREPGLLAVTKTALPHSPYDCWGGVDTLNLGQEAQGKEP